MTTRPPGPPPRRDTWGVRDDAGAWITTGPSTTDPEPWQAWAYSVVDGARIVLDGFFQQRTVEVRTERGAISVNPGPSQTWRGPAGELRDVVAVEAELDVRAWYRTTDGNLVHDWLRLPQELVVSRSGSGVSEAYLRLHHTLFCPNDPLTNARNDTLYDLNAPLLGRALTQWERTVGPITRVEGRYHPFRYGFADVQDDST